MTHRPEHTPAHPAAEREAVIMMALFTGLVLLLSLLAARPAQ